jgi:hypothetical protein
LRYDGKKPREPIMTRIAYNPRLWRKHILQHHVYSDLNLPEVGLRGGESPTEEALWAAAMDSVGIPPEFRGEVKRQYQEFSTNEALIRSLLKKKDKQSGSPYLNASKLCSLFERSAREAGVEDHPDFLANREQLFWNTLVDFGIYYDIYGAGYLRDVVALFRSGDYEKGLAPMSVGERALQAEGEELSPDVGVEVSGYARRALLLYGAGPLTAVGVSRASAVGRFAIHRFKNFLRFVVGAKMFSLAGDALLEGALALAQWARLVDLEAAARLDDLAAGREAARHYEDERPEAFEQQVQQVLVRLRRAEPAISQAFADGWIDPEERVLLRYLFPHVFGIGEQAIARFLVDAESATRLCAGLKSSGQGSVVSGQ